LLSNVTALNNLASGQNGVAAPNEVLVDGDLMGVLPKSSINLATQLTSLETSGHEGLAAVDPVLEELNMVRTREITSKAVVGFLLILLKWFRLSRTFGYIYIRV
jgi:hypothetical protein